MRAKASAAKGGCSPERTRAWESFGERLQKVLRKLKEDHALIVLEKGTNRFVQFMGQGTHGMRAETVSNAYLSGRDKFSAAQIKSLTALGWAKPTGMPDEATPEKQPEGSPNFMRQFPKPVDAKAVAALAVATLADVMRVPHPGFLCYDGRNVDTGGSLTWNDLELKRVEPQNTLAEAARQLLQTLRAETGNEALDFDEDGDIGLRYGSVMVFVKVSGDTPSVRIHAPVLLEVRKSPELLERLNELNSRVVRPAFFHATECVVAVADFPAAPFEAQHVVRALREFCTLADGIDALLQGEFGGRTAFAEAMVSTKIH
jgi:hypothetical protein